MVPRRSERLTAQAGFSLAELLVVIAVIGILAALTAPFFISYYQSAALKAAAEELVTFLNQGRQIAIKENQTVCVHTTSGAIHLHVNGCSGSTWVGPGTDASGNWKVPQGFTLASTAEPQFSYLGAAAPAATYTVTNSANGRTLSVTVSASGRVNVGP
ncbi:MAG: GspH/FimT family pseudopilin [Candidatus Rokubacteria bacterium]|nr:GspH/FimT family pseudopilin [Candidatus Rokubacteria bacterium]